MNIYADHEEKRQTIVICDSEMEYASHLAEYLYHCQELPCALQIYSGIEVMRQYISAGQTALLVVAESLYDPKLLEDGYEHILLLNESGIYIEAPENLSKYQKVENIVAKIYAMLAKEETEVSSIRHCSPMKLIGIYTPVLDPHFSELSYDVARECSRKASVLYLNLDPYVNLEKMSACSFEENIRDLVYYNDCAKEKFAMKLHMIAKSDSALKVLPSAHPWPQIRSIGVAQWQDLFRSIEQVSDYQYLIVVLSEVVEGLLDLLRCCDKVVTFCKDDSFSQVRMEQYESLLKETGYEDIYIKTVKYDKCRREGVKELVEKIL